MRLVLTTKPPCLGSQGGEKSGFVVASPKFPPPFSESVVNAYRAGDLALSAFCVQREVEYIWLIYSCATAPDLHRFRH